MRAIYGGVKPQGEKMSEARFEEYNETINALVAESIQCSPNTWTSGTLNIDCDGNAINYKLKNPNESGKAELSGELRGLCEELYVTMRQNGDIWIEAIIDFFQKDDSWSFNVKFNYDDSPAQEQQPEEATNKKPWWKVW